MKSPKIVLSITLLAAGAFCPNLHADWGSLHGNNRSALTPSAAPRAQPQQVNHAPPVDREPQITHAQPVVRPQPQSPPRQEIQPPREQPRSDEHTPSRSVTVDRPRAQPPAAERVRAVETDRRRMDIDQDRRQSFFWSDYHKGMRIGRLPDGYRRIGIRGHAFFYFEGVYYDNGPSGYVVVAPPLDADIPDLPSGAETVVVNGMVYYYVGGAFYVQQANGYVVVTAPIGVTVAELPPDAVSLVVNGTVYYQADGAFYLPIIQNGVSAYLTVAQP